MGNSNEKSEQDLRDETFIELGIDEQAYRDLKRMLENNDLRFRLLEFPDDWNPKPTSDLAKAFLLATEKKVINQEDA